MTFEAFNIAMMFVGYLTTGIILGAMVYAFVDYLRRTE
jgi:hypothetical protein